MEFPRNPSRRQRRQQEAVSITIFTKIINQRLGIMATFRVRREKVFKISRNVSIDATVMV